MSALGISCRRQQDRPRFVIAIAAVLFFFMAFLPIAVFHEVGHLVVCYYHDGEGYFTSIVPFSCSRANIEHVEILRFAGGAFGAVAALIPLAFWHKYKRHALYRGLLIAFLTISFWEFQKAILEATHNMFYSSEPGGVTMLAIAFIVGTGFYFWLGRSKNITEGWPKPKAQKQVPKK